MSLENPFFCDRFTPEDYTTVGVLRSAFKRGERYKFPHYEPVMLDPGGRPWKPKHIDLCYCSGIHEGQKFGHTSVKTSRWRAIETIYELALRATILKYPAILNVEWKPLLPNWREIVLVEDHQDAADYFIKQLQTLADRGVAVDIGCSLGPSPEGNYRNSEEDKFLMSFVLDADEITDDLTKPIRNACHSGTKFDIPHGIRTYRWENLKDLVRVPTSKQLELVNHEDARPPVCEIDQAMNDAFSSFNLDEGVRLLDAGANINGFDKYGNSALSSMAEAFETDIASEDDHERCIELKKIRVQGLRILIERGADLNLACYTETDALINATLKAEPEMVRLLLEAGADPNYNPWPEDDLWTVSQALDYASTDAWLERGTPEGDSYEEIRQMLEAHGAVFRREP